MNIFTKKDMRNATVAEQFVARVENESRNSLIRLYAPMILLVVMTIGFSIYDSHFFSVKNVVNILGQMAVPLILATGLTFVLLIGSIDLSVEGGDGLCRLMHFPFDHQLPQQQQLGCLGRCRSHRHRRCLRSDYGHPPCEAKNRFLHYYLRYRHHHQRHCRFAL